VVQAAVMVQRQVALLPEQDWFLLFQVVLVQPVVPVFLVSIAILLYVIRVPVKCLCGHLLAVLVVAAILQVQPVPVAPAVMVAAAAVEETVLPQVVQQVTAAVEATHTLLLVHGNKYHRRFI
jgi:hypothetical protein